MIKTFVSRIPSAAGTIGLHVLTFGMAGFLFLSGGAKLLGMGEMVQLYQSLGLGQWFRYLSGGIEVAAGVLLLIPRMRVVAILLAAAAMIAGIAKHFFAQGGVPSFPVLVFAAVLVVLYIKRPGERVARPRDFVH